MKTFKTNITSIYGNKGKAWLSALPKLVEEISLKWELSDLQEVSNLSYNYVLSGFQEAQPIILKLSLDEGGLRQEADTLRAFSDFGGVSVLEEQANALLLKRAIPGTSLKDSFSKGDQRAIHIACQVAQKLHQAPMPQKSFPHIREWLKALDHSPEFIAARTTPDNRNHIVIYLAKARYLRDKLLQNASEAVLLHGDLHPENVLQNGEDWVVIDPKGVIGPPIHEVWAFIMNFETDAPFVADFFAFDLQELREWYFVHLNLALCWNIEDGTSLNPYLSLAKKVYPLV
jgi:streptomycin 6-kinase